SITIPNSVTSIGEYAFSFCKALTSITIPDSVIEIEIAAFWNCSSLTSITIPSSVTAIGSSTFEGCSSLNSVYCKPTTPPAGSAYMFDDNASDRKIYVPESADDSIIKAYKSATYWRNYASAMVEYSF
ncbi:MAG: leucine-rich repeat domain-containing protein, partial [Alistipes sp.]|nr:leucine-rich repeat domain-containing protein [Alistipes sp.]